MNISKYLTLEEATKSPTAKRLGIENLPDDEQLLNMQFVGKKIFDPCRELCGGPLMASSFFRSKELNDATPGSSATSQHMTGEAVDMDCDAYGNGDNLSLFHFIRDTLDFDQLILEYPDATGKPSWIHCSARRLGKHRGQVLVKLKTKYIPYSTWKPGMT